MVFRKLLDRLGRYRRSNRLVGHLPAQPQGTLDGYPHETERLVGEDLDLLAFHEVAVEAGDLVDLRARDLLALLAERLAHLHEQLAGVDELHLAASLRGFAVGDDPEVGRDAGVVEQLVR